MTDNEVLDLRDRWAAAEQDNDPRRLGAVLAPDFVGVGAAGTVRSAAAWQVAAVHLGTLQAPASTPHRELR